MVLGTLPANKLVLDIGLRRTVQQLLVTNKVWLRQSGKDQVADFVLVS
jgi:hypothetical protein